MVSARIHHPTAHTTTTEPSKLPLKRAHLTAAALHHLQLDLHMLSCTLSLRIVTAALLAWQLRSPLLSLPLLIHILGCMLLHWLHVLLLLQGLHLSLAVQALLLRATEIAKPAGGLDRLLPASSATAARQGDTCVGLVQISGHWTHLK